MTTTKELFDTLVFIGRFQPYHNGHQHIVELALRKSHRLIILVGSPHLPRSTRNPWLFSERESMIRATLSSDENARVCILPIPDAMYNDLLWTSNVQKIVNNEVKKHHSHKDFPKIGLIGKNKDATSYYLKLFPQWQSVEVKHDDNTSSTDLRDLLFSLTEDKLTPEITHLVPSATKNWLTERLTTDSFNTLKNEYDFIKRYKEGWENAPYPPTFVTVDAVVIQSGHILLVERRALPGKGQWALPGGFIREREGLEEACLRELKEETKLKVPLPVLKGSITDQQVFDSPFRSTRGRTITHAFLIELKADVSLPKVRGADDASRAFWLPLAQLKSDQLFEDHYFIIQKLIGLGS